MGKVLTITRDSGKECSNQEELAEELDLEVYFTHPYAYLEGELNGNTNGLFRQYFPKNRELLVVKPEELGPVVAGKWAGSCY